MKRTRVLVVILTLLGAALLAQPVVAQAAAGGDPGPNVVPLGFAIHRGRLVEGFAFVHTRDPVGSARPDRPSKAKPGTVVLYDLLAKGARWKTTEGYVIDPSNGDGADGGLVVDAFARSVETWDSQVAFDVFGPGTTVTGGLAADWVAPDGLNEVYFSSSELDPNTVAVTITWGVFSGRVSGRELFEWDMVFNDALAEPWGFAEAGGAQWDVENIATHELGHSAGLGDLYDIAAYDQTMYGYASPDETKKRTLESGDIAGITALYP